ncbi:MAG: FapA family protein [Treponema sp.]|nr:FapA family protein [Treponema sp.]
MVDFVQLQQIVRERLEQDRNVRTVDVSGATLEDAVAEAATLLNIPVRRLEYEITERGSAGFLGSGKKNWTISAYERIVVKKEKKRAAKKEAEEEEAEAKINENADGAVFLHLSIDGAFLKAVPPKGNGRRAAASDAFKILQERYVSEYNNEQVTGIVRDAAGEYVRVGSFEHRPINDSMISGVDLSEGEMKAYITVTPPGVGGCDISVETYLSFLRNNRVVYGVNEEFLRDFADKPHYKEKVLIAEGLKEKNGRDAYIHYNFETDQGKVKLREASDGRIDFKELNIIKNVVEKQPLAKKMPPEQGVPGRTVTGKAIPAKNGKDIALPVGKHVSVAGDGVTIIADINGQVVLGGGKINVEEVHNVQGDVNLKTGNIIMLGTVIINGNVDDGFEVRAAGNIEVSGTVGKAILDAEGDIIVHKGINGKSSGTIKAGRSIWARFIENAIVESGNMVIVSDGIINSQVDAFKRIICRGKRANIVGGRLRASEEINAKSLGSPTGSTETICEVGIDPKSKLQLESLAEKKAAMEKQLEDLQLNLQTLISIKKQRKSLPKDKEDQMGELMDKRQLLVTDLKKNAEETARVQEYYNSIKTRGRVSASVKVYPGVKVYIREALNNVITEYKAVTFILENGLIRVTKYEEPDDEATRAPDGYTTN